MPIKSHGEVNMPENKREHKAVKRDETVLKATEGSRDLDPAVRAKRR